MKYAIHVDNHDAPSANHNRGYHNYDATVRFEYANFEESHFTVEREAEIVKDLLEPNGSMWYYPKSPSLGVWEVNHGSDSGD